MLFGGRFFLFLLLVADWAGDPYCGNSPLSRPYASQDAFCHSVAHRTILQKVITLDFTDIPLLQAASSLLPALNALLVLRWLQTTPFFLPAKDPVYALMSLQC